MLVRRFCIAAATLLIGALTSGPSGAQDLSILLQQGRAAFEAGDFTTAAARAEAAVRAAPADPRPHALQGFALNRLGRFREAFLSLSRARDLGLAQPRLQLEYAQAAVETGRWDEALPAIRAYEARVPGTGIAQVLLGRAELGRGNRQAAEAAFAEALRRDPRLDLPALRGIAQSAAAAGIAPDAIPDYVTGRLGPRPEARAPGEAAPLTAQKPWSIDLSVGAGYNSNVIGLGDRIARPADISHQDSGFLSESLTARYAWMIDGASRLTAGFGLTGVQYFDLGDLNLADGLLSLDYTRRLSSNWGISLRAFGGHLLIDGDSLRTQAGLRPAAAYRWDDRNTTELAYTGALARFHESVAVTAFDRDGHSHALSLSHLIAEPSSGVQLLLGTSGAVSDTDGSDFDSRSIAFLAQVTVPWTLNVAGQRWRMAAQFQAGLGFDFYDNPNSLSGTGQKRRDDVVRLGAALHVPLTDLLEVYTGYTYTNNASSIAFYDYHQHVVTAGLTARF